MTDVSTGPTAAYLALSHEDQVEALRPAALEAAAGFGLAVAAAEVVAHAYNTTFAVTTTDGVRWALRVGTSSQSTPAHAVAQQEWLRAIAAETDVHVPEPLSTLGRRVVRPRRLAGVRPTAAGHGGVVAGGPGRRPVRRGGGARPGARDGHAAPAVGRLGPARTAGACRRSTSGCSATRTGSTRSPVLTDDDRQVLAATRERTAEAYRRVYEGAAVQVLHADLHGGNLKWHGGRLAVFDLDDCGLGVPALDLAISTFYLRDGDPAPERGLLAGYAEVAPLPDADPADVEALMADRQMLLANTILTSSAADLRSEAETYLPVAVRRLRRWLDTGVLTRAPFDD